MAVKPSVFFGDALKEHTSKIKAALSKDYTCFTSNEPEEYNQAFQQNGKFVLVFSDPKEAIRILHTGSNWLNGCHYKTYVYLNRVGTFTPESQKMLNVWSINVFNVNESQKLIDNINEFFKKTGGPDLNVDELEFYMPPADDDDGKRK
jgi:hypothetical protein